MSTGYSLRALRIGFIYPQNPVSTFEDVSFHLSDGWCGLVGENGAGKTTLLRLLAGELRPTVGELVREPPKAPTLLCAQRVDICDDPIVDAAQRWDKEAMRLKSRLGLDYDGFCRWETLSPGERKRWQIGAALMARPAILLLDEPTNHLDAEGRRWLLEAMRLHRGVGIVVSHDRVLLDAVTASTLWVESGQVSHYRLPYSSAREERDHQRENIRQKRARLEDRKNELVRRSAEAERRRASADRSISARNRMKSLHDNDARSMAAKERAKSVAGAMGKSSGIVSRELERVTEELDQVGMFKDRGRSIFVDYQRCPKDPVASVENLDLSAGDRVLLSEVTLWLGREERIELRGPNGAGKTTFLRALLNHLHIPRERVLYLPQELSAEDVSAVRHKLTTLHGDVLGEVMNIVAALGADPQKLLEASTFSPGELRKLVLAIGLHSQVWAVFLDEPTNHLDLPSIERLEEALVDYPGALVLITHDHRFASTCTDGVWEIEDCRLLASRQNEGPRGR